MYIATLVSEALAFFAFIAPVLGSAPNSEKNTQLKAPLLTDNSIVYASPTVWQAGRVIRPDAATLRQVLEGHAQVLATADQYGVDLPKGKAIVGDDHHPKQYSVVTYVKPHRPVVGESSSLAVVTAAAAADRIAQQKKAKQPVRYDMTQRSDHVQRLLAQQETMARARSAGAARQLYLKRLSRHIAAEEGIQP